MSFVQPGDARGRISLGRSAHRESTDKTSANDRMRQNR